MYRPTRLRQHTAARWTSQRQHVTSASTTTEVDISTTTTTTTTVSTPVASSPAPAGFTPIASEPAIIAANGPANRRRSRSERHSKITVEREAAGKAKTNVDPNAQKVKAVNGQPQCPKDLYPESVSCIKRVEVIETSTHTATAKSKITKTLPRKTSTVSATSTVKVTSTAANPDASTTVTETTTTTATPLVTQTSTSVTTLTSTSTSYAPATTSYADCQANNLISQVSGNPINAIQFEFDLKVSGNSDSDLDCCIQCHDSDKCGGFAYMSNLCYQFTGPQGGAVCDGSMEAFGFLTSTDDDPAYTIGNGGCGQGRFHGIDD
ncbi:MAG: hypothetical protein M1828_005034 [Chrysothrix sp. TS-e1954]|nr:MAG: hypothetical protein M1828_005034 [Chrysothrix sp. TS-e1954]